MEEEASKGMFNEAALSNLRIAAEKQSNSTTPKVK
jgi:hypothetical protein